MRHTGPIILVDDDTDDQQMAVEVIRDLDLPNKVVSFTNCLDVLEYLIKNDQDEAPFMILSDINIPRMTGIELKREIQNHSILQKKFIPFIYYSTSASPATLKLAFEMSVQGFFIKKNSVAEMKSCFKVIFDYWTETERPDDPI